MGGTGGVFLIRRCALPWPASESPTLVRGLQPVVLVCLRRRPYQLKRHSADGLFSIPSSHPPYLFYPPKNMWSVDGLADVGAPQSRRSAYPGFGIGPLCWVHRRANVLESNGCPKGGGHSASNSLWGIKWGTLT